MCLHRGTRSGFNMLWTFMASHEPSDSECSHCGGTVTAASQFCPWCGSVFTDNLFCPHHPTDAAVGVCVICSQPCCAKCGGETVGVFLCDTHWQYETHEGMARVYGTIDNVQAQYVTSCLEHAGLHPFLYTRHFNPGPGMINSWARAGIRNYGNHTIIELKVLVPFAEVHRAEEVLTELQLEPPAL
jgi:hypothetical protein